MIRKPLKTKIKLEIAGSDIIIEDADIELEIKKTNEAGPNYCTITVYNLSDNTYNRVNDKALYVRCYCDMNDSGYSLIFEGDLRNIQKYKKIRKSKAKKPRKKKTTTTPSYNEPPVRTEDDGPDVKTVIELQDGLKTIFTNFHYAISYKGKVSNIDILNDCLRNLQGGNVGLGQIDTPNEHIFAKYSYSGPIINLASQMASMGGCNLTLQNGVISCIKKGGKNLDWVYVLDGTNCPRPEMDTNKEINVEAPPLPNLNPDNLVKLNFDKISGTYKVKKMETKINNYGASGQGSKVVCKSDEV